LPETEVNDSDVIWRAVTELYLRRCLRRESAPRVKELAAILHLAPDQLSRAFATSTGRQISEHIRNLLVEYSKELLRGEKMSVTMVAYRSGFENRRTFFRFFRRRTGKTPASFRSRP
jgi:AraC-like DNA-binding protein